MIEGDMGHVDVDANNKFGPIGVVTVTVVGEARTWRVTSYAMRDPEPD